jgi:hypothetical protein
MFGGDRLLSLWLENKARLRANEAMRVRRNILNTLEEHRAKIRSQQLYEIEDWVDTWKDNEILIGEY